VYLKEAKLIIADNQWPAPSKAWVKVRSLAGIVVKNPAEGMDVCRL
jgi:hypothetical protein